MIYVTLGQVDIYNIRKDLKEIGINTKNWVDQAQDRDYWRALLNATLNGVNYEVPYSHCAQIFASGSCF